MRLPESTRATRPARARRPLAAGATAAVVATLLLASACGAGGNAGGGSAAARTAPAPSPTPVGDTGAGAPCVTRPGAVCVTEGARGHTVQLAVGWILTLRLGAPGRRFSAPVQEAGGVLRALGPPRRSGTEVITRFQALKQGTVQLRATERPLCRAGLACPDYVALWTLTVRVNRRP